ncbi:MAG: hypothetical protein IKD66_13915, partial [Solobacterium sp.]|nr:hypothetical protein [Solobacterium sp.]
MKNKYYGILKLFLLLSLVFSSGMNVRALEEEGDTEAPPEAAAEENLPEEIPETVGEEEPPAAEKETSESVDEEKPETAEEADPEPSSEEDPEAVNEEPETEEKEESGSEGESEALEEAGNSPLNYVAAEELEPGTSYVLAYEEEGSYTLLGAKGKELQTISLPALNEETVSGNVWVLE